MTTIDTEAKCLRCGRDDLVGPLVALRHAGQTEWICPQCLPVLIHHPEQIEEEMAIAREARAAGGAT